MITTKELSTGITLRCFTDGRFKQNCLSLQLLRPMCRQEAALNALIPNILLRGCQSAPDLRRITLRLDDLYGASLGPLVRQIGDYQSVGLYCSFISDDFALEGDRVMEPAIDFLRELLLNPVRVEGFFDPEILESEKKNQISTLETVKNDKRSYAMRRMIRHMCSRDAYGLSRLGEIEDVRAITPQSAWEHYQKILRESPVELFYVGQKSPDEVEKLLRPLCDSLAKEAKPMPPQTDFTDGGAVERTETAEMVQARLCLGYTTPMTIRTESFAAMQVCNALLGGGMTSKLFMNVREKLSLCYDISSGFRSSKGLLLITAGVDPEKLEIAKQEIFAQVQACKDGDFTDGELAAAKQSLITALQGVHDSPGGIEDYYITMCLASAKLTPEAYLRAVEQVTAECVRKAAQSLTLHTQYVLKGDK